MGVLDFFAKREGEGADEHAANPGAQNAAPDFASVDASATGPSSSDLATAQSVAARTQASELLQTSPRRRGRPPKGATAGAGNHRVVSASGEHQISPEMQAEINKALEAVYAPKAWGALLGMPADAVAAITGKERWQLSSPERETLGVTGSAAARVFSITNPRGLAVFMLASAITSAYLPRAMAEMREMFDKKRAEKMRAKKPDAA